GMAMGLFFARPNLAHQGLQGLAASFANVGYMGLPLYITAYGADQALPAVVATVFTAAIGLGLGIAVTEIGRSDRAGRRMLRDLARALATNPLLLATVAGLAM